ncbi:MAG: beta-ketoacyl-[acyl-carrier-protein] synthase family protein [Bacteroidetes bacterium]|nr:beta-ketoacyl-[acyl-carrier-protein] synthase family protein [Bacteroidota bacterium]
MSTIFVTGIGIYSPLGADLKSNHLALKKGICAISPLELIPSFYAKKMPVGEIKEETPSLKEKLRITQNNLTRTTLLALKAFDDAVHDAHLTNNVLASKSTAFINASTVGGMCLTDELYKDANAKKEGSDYLNSYDLGSVALYIQERYRLQGIINTINTACSASANAIMYGARLIQHGFAERAIVGGVDSLAKFTINGFNSLQILSDELCRPFDANRKGLNLGEGAAFLVLEKEKNIKSKKAYAQLSGYCNANDAFHPSSISENAEGPFLAMQGALHKAGLQAQDISFVNTHGTATLNNDETESMALLRLFTKKIPLFASTKSNIGHTLGAAGAIEAVYSILNIIKQEAYPSLHFTQPISKTGLSPLTEYKKISVNHVLSNSFGFGGNCSSLLFSKI